jgi:hypothetical protein
MNSELNGSAPAAASTSGTSGSWAKEASLRFVAPSQRPMSAEERHAAIAVAAYHLAERRNFAPGHEAEDWLAAEAQIDWRGT